MQKSYPPVAIFISFDGADVRSRSVAFMIPNVASDPTLKKIYENLDLWDVTLCKLFSMEDIRTRSVFRRVSPRYLPILASQVEILVQQLEASDELDRSKNTEVVSLSLSFKRDNLPG